MPAPRAPRATANATSMEATSGTDIASATTYEFARLNLQVQTDIAAMACNIFLHNDRICPLRNRRAGKNPNGFAMTEA